ncbi:MAG TPA: protein-disulfide reductase DsbD N-terminal domain-containing protein [Pyrinomonadaceae bacterium]|jgi:DsbC/DsbD-like thiol-disulfide interchange protein|nr:protein-disulfide reductase DsbD N-terminal domain-containing protein [Pyrinomonadaceae bacterium]
MRRKLFAPLACALLISAALSAPPSHGKTEAPNVVAAPAASPAPGPLPQSSNIGINGFFSVDPAQQGSSFQAAIVMEIPRGMHVNSNKPLGKYAVPTVVKVDSPRGLRVTPVSYPRSSVRSFSFGGAGAERLAVYEGKAIFRFTVNVAPGAEQQVARVRVSVRFQSCNDEVCFPPATRELTLPIAIVNRGTPVNRINHQYFGGGGRRRR